MSGTSEFTQDQKLKFVVLAQKEGRAAAAKKAGVSTTTISLWAKAHRVDLRSGTPAPKKPPANGKANGHAPEVVTGSGAPAAVVTLDTVKEQLLTALQSVDALKAAFRRTFG